jgi:Coenzyme PQQ synthesis protein D (PqqD)
MTQRFCRNPAVAETPIEGEVFLVGPDDGAVFYLDEVTCALWRLLAAPHSAAEIETVFAAAFPEIDRRVLAADIAAALKDLRARSLVVSVRETPSAPSG